MIGEPEAVIRNFTAMCCPGKKSGGWVPSSIASSKERTSSLSCFTAWTRSLRNPVQADAKDDQNIFKENLDRVELGPLKGTEGDQNYSIPAGTDLSKYKTVAIYCERFNVTFGAAPLQK